MKKIIGKKSYKAIVLFAITYIILMSIYFLFLYSYFWLDNELCLIFSIIIGILLIYLGYILFQMIILPKNAIECDDFGIYLNFTKKHSIYLLYRDIDSVHFENERGRGITYKFGKLYIYTNNKKYKIYEIDNVNYTYKFIKNRILYKYKY